MFFPPGDATATTTPQRRKTDDRPDLVKMAKVEKYWRSLIGDAQIPRRTDVDPTAVSEALGDSMVLERVAPGIARIRLAGQRINTLFDMDMRGMPLSVVVTPTCRDALSSRIEAAFEGPALVEVPLTLARGWRKDIEARLLILPLLDNQDNITRALAMLVTRQEMPTGNTTRFSITHDDAGRCTFLPAPRVRTANTPYPSADRRAPTAHRDPHLAPRGTVTREIRPERQKSKPFSVVDGDVKMPPKSRIEIELAPEPEVAVAAKSHLRLVVSR